MQVSIRLSRFGDDFLLTSDPRPQGDTLTLLGTMEARALLGAWMKEEPARSIVRRALAELGPLPWSGAESDDVVFAWALEQIDLGWLHLMRGRPVIAAHRFVIQRSEQVESGGEATTEEEHWIQIQVVDDDGEPVPNVAFALTLPNRRVMNGTTNQYGVIYVSGLDAGTCKLTLPNLDQETWEQA